MAQARSLPVVANDDSLTSDWDYFLDRTVPHARDDARVVRIRQDPDFDPDKHMLCFAGLEEMLYYNAYATIRLPLLAYKIGLTRPSNEDRARNCRVEVACALAEELKFKRIPPATRCALYERGDAAILLYQHPVEPGFLSSLAGDDAREVARLAEFSLARRRETRPLTAAKDFGSGQERLFGDGRLVSSSTSRARASRRLPDQAQLHIVGRDEHGRQRGPVLLTPAGDARDERQRAARKIETELAARREVHQLHRFSPRNGWVDR